MSTFGITYGTGAFLGPGNEPTQTETDDIAYYCGRSCAAEDLDAALRELTGGSRLADPAGTAWRPEPDDGEAFVVVTTTPMVSWGDMPCATSEVDYIVACEGCGTYLNATELESFDTHRRTVEAGFREVIGWAVERGFELDDEARATLAVADDDRAPDDESLQWLFEAAEQHLNGLDGYYFEQDGDTATTSLWVRDMSDPARVQD